MSLNVFQSSKSALIFAGAVIVTALMLVGPKQGGGVLDSAAQNVTEERERITANAQNVSRELSGQPYVPDAPKLKPTEIDHMIDPNLGVSAFTGTGQSYGNSYGGGSQYGNPALAPISPEAGTAPSLESSYAPPPEAPRGEAVVTSRFIQIEPQ